MVRLGATECERTMRRRLVGLLSVIAAGCAGTSDEGGGVIDEPLVWVAADSSDEIVGAEKRPSGPPHGEVVLFFMGATTPAGVAFDLAVPGYSWSEHLASLGYRVVRWDPTGYGSSSDPPELDQPPSRNHPITRTAVVEEQAERVADEVAARTGDEGFHVICWSAGCAPALAFAAKRPERVQSLVLHSATFGPLSPLGLAPFDPNTSITNFVGAYRLASAADVAERWDRMIPVDDKTAYRDPAVFETWVRDFLASDATASEREPASVRVPNGMLADSYEVLLGHPPYDVSQVVAPTLVIRGSDDPETNTRGSNLLLEALGSTDKALVEVPLGTHYVTVERNHLTFWEAVDAFLAEH